MTTIKVITTPDYQLEIDFESEAINCLSESLNFESALSVSSVHCSIVSVRVEYDGVKLQSTDSEH